ncbi:unnamed protein product [Peronospora belbahrii]|uniref:25S rRNA (uridine-N(3))-methyltransferase BMT5-like domain-containing protein n=1 Tax=Peronospora belbahrii TaxID=622444 RepID=A0AAU9L498_9STRA|nr:unnamed protein product [Peronospora belbahrii]
MTVTSLDSESQLREMYPTSRDILNELHSEGAHVRHEVNATKLERYLFHNDGNDPVKFNRVVFNFPHYVAGGGVGNKDKCNKIHRHRQLLLNFFTSASQVLAHDGQIWVTLCAGQEETSLETKTRSAGDTWQIVHCAAAAKLLLQDAHDCPVDALADLGYYSVGYQSRDKAFWIGNGITNVFCHEATDHKPCFSIQWTRGISFWVTDEQLFTEDLLLDIIRKHFLIKTMTVSISLLDEYRCVKSGRKSVTYRFNILSFSLALFRDRVNTLVETHLDH